MVLHDTKSYLFLIGFLILICLPMAALCGKRDKVIADKELEVERAGQHLPLEEWGARPFRHIEAYARTGETNIGDAPEDRRELRDRMSMEG
ncbi:hypothetical protein NW766_010810 [Fusarium irregulare]|uniref:Uncharacterized protein n=1 Tax=Fusarium irregulare TaxID=2494466 RepID=A0A9W8PGF1_9HYPO|nr:hypothetical protein NW766_010810 [Fusarium irregulare]